MTRLREHAAARPEAATAATSPTAPGWRSPTPGGKAAGSSRSRRATSTTPPVGGARAGPRRVAAANAREATQDSTAIAYLGDFDSGATRPRCRSRTRPRMLQVSPASGAVDLVAARSSAPETRSPDVQPSGERTFGRVIPSDEAQAAAAAGWASAARVRASVATRSDGSAASATRWSPGSRTRSRGPTWSATARGARLLRRANPPSRAAEPRPGDRQALMVTDAELVPDGRRGARTGTLATVGGRSYPAPAARRPGQRFAARVRRRYGRARRAATPPTATRRWRWCSTRSSAASEPTDRDAVDRRLLRHRGSRLGARHLLDRRGRRHDPRPARGYRLTGRRVPAPAGSRDRRRALSGRGRAAPARAR